MRPFPILLCGLLAALLLSACGQQPAEIPAEPEIAEPVEAPEEPAVKTEFTREELLADYDQLWEILEENYPFLPVLEEHGIDWEQLRADYREKLISQKPDVAGFAALIRELFGKMENFAHLQVVSQDLYANYAAGAQNPELLENDPWVRLASGEQTAATYAQLAVQRTLPRSTGDPAIETAYYPDCKAAYFRIRGFPAAQVERDRTVIADYLAGLDEVEHIILDVTGNGGGYEDYLKNVILYPFGESLCVENYYFFAKSPVSETFFWDTGLNPQPLSELPEDAVYPEFAGRLGMDFFFRDTFELDTDGYDGPVIGSDAKRWVLIDGQCYSMADVFARLCKETGWATLVGTPTAGDGGSVSPMAVPLDQTGLLIRFSGGSRANADGTLNAETGTKPDYPCKSGETPLQKCLELIRSGQ